MLRFYHRLTFKNVANKMLMLYKYFMISDHFIHLLHNGANQSVLFRDSGAVH